jgi:hypothetical protein
MKKTLIILGIILTALMGFVAIPLFLLCLALLGFDEQYYGFGMVFILYTVISVMGSVALIGDLRKKLA